MAHPDKIRALSDAITAVLVALVDIAKDGGDGLPATPVEPAPRAERKGRPPKADAAPAAGQTSADEVATRASGAIAAMDVGLEATGDDTDPTPSTTEPESTDTLETAKALAVQLSQAPGKGREALVAVLGNFGLGQPGQGVSKLKPDQIGPFCDAVREVLES